MTDQTLNFCQLWRNVVLVNGIQILKWNSYIGSIAKKCWEKSRSLAISENDMEPPSMLQIKNPQIEYRCPNFTSNYWQNCQRWHNLHTKTPFWQSNLARLSLLYRHFKMFRRDLFLNSSSWRFIDIYHVASSWQAFHRIFDQKLGFEVSGRMRLNLTKILPLESLFLSLYSGCCGLRSVEVIQKTNIYNVHFAINRSLIFIYMMSPFWICVMMTLHSFLYCVALKRFQLKL